MYIYGIDITKRFSDGKGDMSKVEFIVHNDTDNYFLTGKLNESEGVWYVNGHVAEEKSATHFIPTKEGKLIIKGVEDDSYTMTEVRTDNAYAGRALRPSPSISVSRRVRSSGPFPIWRRMATSRESTATVTTAASHPTYTA